MSCLLTEETESKKPGQTFGNITVLLNEILLLNVK